MAGAVKLEGFKELEKELARIDKATTAKAALRRSLKKSAQPMADLMVSLAPDDPETAGDDLKSSIAVGTKLSKKQGSAHRKMFRNDKAAVEMFVGPGVDPAAWNQEFGNINHGPQPFVRPAWDRDHRALVDRLGRLLWDDIQKTVARAERRAAKQRGE